MIKIGRSIRWYNDYQDEVIFSRENHFDFNQIWFMQGEIVLDKVNKPKEKMLKNIGFPLIFHAVLDINEFEKYEERLIEILNYLEQKELIIHPICKSTKINKESIYKLSEKVSAINLNLKSDGITLYLENNSKIDPIFYTIEEIEILFKKNPGVELLLDIAHMDNYEHLKEIVNIKKPKILHIADKKFSSDHEHLPIGKGELDFSYIFKEVLNDFDGKIIFEVVERDELIIKSKEKIEKILR